MFSSHRNLGNSLPVHQGVLYREAELVINPLLIGDTNLQLLGMNIDIDFLTHNIQIQQGEGIFVLHQKAMIGILDGLRNHLVFYISSVDEVIFKGTVSSCHIRISDEAVDMHQFGPGINCHKFSREISAENLIHNFFEIAVSAGIELVLSVLDEFKGNLRMRKCQFLYKGTDMIAFCHRRLQEFCSGRSVEKEIADDKRRSTGSTDFLIFLLNASFYTIPDAGQSLRCLGDAFHLSHGRDTGESLTTEAQRGYIHQILCLADLTGGVAQKGLFYLIRRDTGSVIRDPHERCSAIPDLNGHCSGSGVDGVFRELLDDRGRPLDDFTGSNLVNGLFVQ